MSQTNFTKKGGAPVATSGALILTAGNAAPPPPAENQIALFVNETGDLCSRNPGGAVTVITGGSPPVTPATKRTLKFSGLCDGNTSQIFSLADTGRGFAPPYVGNYGYPSISAGTITGLTVYVAENTCTDKALVTLYVNGNVTTVERTVSVGTTGATAWGNLGAAINIASLSLLDLRVFLSPGELGSLLVYAFVEVTDNGE